MKILLGATIAVLLVALAASWQAMKNGESNTSPDEMTRLRKQIAELRAEQDSFQREKERQQLRGEISQSPVNAEVEAMKLELERKRLAEEESALAKDREERDKGLSRDEEGLLAQRDLEKKDSELRRARLIQDALLVGKVQEYIEDPEVGTFMTFHVMMPELVQTGIVVGVRRKTGILAQFTVTDISPDGAIASPLPGFMGANKPEAGDELILPPQY